MATAIIEGAPVVLPVMADSPYVQRAKSTADKALALTVTSVLERTDAAELGRAIVQLDREVEEFFKPMKESAYQTHRKICEREKEVRGPLESAKQYLSRQIGSFDAQLEAERRLEQARLQEEARLQAVAEAQKLAEEQALNDAIALEAEGDKQGAEAVLNNPVPVAPQVAPVVLERQLPKVQGVATRETWKFRITDASLLPREYTMPDEKAIGQVVKALKGKASIPGVEVYKENSASFRA